MTRLQGVDGNRPLDNEVGSIMDPLVEKLGARLREWKAENVAQVRESVAEVIDLAAQDVLDVTGVRAIGQKVLDSLDESGIKG